MTTSPTSLLPQRRVGPIVLGFFALSSLFAFFAALSCFACFVAVASALFRLRSFLSFAVSSRFAFFAALACFFASSVAVAVAVASMEKELILQRRSSRTDKRKVFYQKRTFRTGTDQKLTTRKRFVEKRTKTRQVRNKGPGALTSGCENINIYS